MVREFRVTGRFVLGALLTFFLTVMAVNMVFINYAVKTFPGEKEKKSYLQGLNYNDRLDARAEQKILGWNVKVNEPIRDGETVTVALDMRRNSGEPLANLDVRGVFSRPTNEAFDQSVIFAQVGDGRYEAAMRAGPGVWLLDGKAVSGSNETFEFTSRILLD